MEVQNVANGVAIRDWLKQQGYTDEDIGWQNGQVTLRGKPFFQPTELRGGRSYASPEVLQSALASLYGTQRPAQQPAKTGSNVIAFGRSQTVPTGTVPVREYLVAKGYDPTKIGWQQETGTVTLGGQYGIAPSTILEGRAYAPRSTIEAALKALGYRTPEEQETVAKKKKTEDLLATLNQALNQPFTYRPEEDPRYQAARQLAEREAESASRRAMEELNVRGILPSTITADRLAQIQQQAASNVAGMIPQLYQSALSERQQYLSNLANLANMFNTLYTQELTQAQKGTPYEEALAEEAKTQQETAKLAQEMEKAYLPYKYAPKSALLPYELGPTPYQQQSLAQQRELGLKEYLYGLTPYQQQSLAQQLQRQQQLSPTERTVDLRAQAANAVQAALDELWRKRPGGPSYAEVAETAQKALDQVKADLARAGIAKKDIDDTIELLKEYISAATGVPLEKLGFEAAGKRPDLEVK
jgi:hypothetical protein